MHANIESQWRQQFSLAGESNILLICLKMPKPFEIDAMEGGCNTEKEHRRFDAMYTTAPVTSRIAKGSSRSWGPREEQI